MKTMTVGDFKANFSSVAEGLKRGNKYVISYGKTKEKIAVLVPFNGYQTVPRKLGLLSGKAKITFSKDFKITDQEFFTL